MKEYKIYILDTSEHSSYGSKYSLLLKHFFEKCYPEDTCDCYLDNPSIKRATEEEMSAEKIINCDYFLVLYQNEMGIYRGIHDQVKFAEAKNKKVYQINVGCYEEHYLFSTHCCDIEEYLQLIMQISFRIQPEKSDHLSAHMSAGCENMNSTSMPKKPASSRKKGHRKKRKASCLKMMVRIIVLLGILLFLILVFCKLLVPIAKKFNGYILQGINSFLDTDISLGDNDLLHFIVFVFCIFIVLFLLRSIISFILLLIRGPILYSQRPEKKVSVDYGDATMSWDMDNDDDSDVSKDFYDIFISYAHNNQHGLDVNVLVDFLKHNNYHPWFDNYMTRSIGGNYNEMIATHILECKSFIPLINQDYVDSEYCRDEFFYARGKNKYIIPVFLEKTQLTPGMEMRLMQQIQCINLYELTSSTVFFENLRTILLKVHC